MQERRIGEITGFRIAGKAVCSGCLTYKKKKDLSK